MGAKEEKADLDQLEKAIEHLKIEYEKYFMGVERRPPIMLRKDTDRLVNRYVGYRSPNTALKFRAQTLVQRMVSYRQLWDRTMQQIEDGTYRRDVMKANRKAQYQPPVTGRQTGHEVIEDAELIEDEPKGKWSGVYDQYVKARSSTQEGTKGISYEKLEKALEKQARQLKEKYKAKDVEFKVVVENGKTRLKATAKR